MPLRRIGLLAFACCVAISACSNAQNFDARVYVDGLDSPSPSPATERDAVVATIYAAALAKDERALLEKRTRQVDAGRTPDPTTALALYTIDPNKYQAMFVAEYPTEPEGVVDDFGRRFGASGVERDASAFPITSLGNIAFGGNVTAQMKLIEALGFAAGSPVERDYVAQVERLAQSEPTATLAALTAVPVPARLAMLSQSDWCAHQPLSLLAVPPSASPQEIAVAGEFREDLSTQCQPAERKSPRHARARHVSKMRHP